MDEEEEIEGAPAFFHRHPLLFYFLLFLAFTYALVYPVFAFILAAVPVFVLTALLLGIVLLHSVPQDHDPHVYKKITHRPPQCQPAPIGGSTSSRHHHQPSYESSDDDSSSAHENDNRPPRAMSTASSHASFPDPDDTAANTESESTDSDHEEKQHNHHRSHKKDAVRAVAWTADDAKSIENIGSLELEMNATVEKLMSRRRARGHQRPLHQHHHQHHHVMDLADDPSKLSIATRKRNPFDLDGPYDEDDNFPDSAPSMLGLRPSRNPFFDDIDDDLHLQAPPQPSSIPGAAQKNAMLFRRHESFTVGAPHVSDFRPSRFRPYFVTEKMQGQPVTVPEASRKSSSSSTSSSSAGATAYAYAYAYASANKEEEAAAEQVEAEAEAATMSEEVKSTVEYSSRSHEVAAVDVELISDSSDDDMTLPGGGHAHKEHQVPVQQQQQAAEQEQQMKMEQEQQMKLQQEQQMKLQQEQQMKEQRMKQQLAEQEQQMKQAAEQERQMKMQQQQQLALSDDDEGDSFEVESITKQVAAAAAGKTKQLETDPAYDYSPSKTEKAAFAQLPPPAPPNKLQTMRRVFSEEDADEPWAAPSGLEETAEDEGREQDMLSAPAAGAAPPLSAAAKKAIGKSTKAYKPPTKKAVLGFFRK
ncbi:protein similar-like [Triticum dicoccoides]|uniref:protein similar-like n=1 Tax=Triticum dicoccoides TaxID=85692 RepID=UPI001891D954|nr:protein similar-like [Triticum dicoccoides]